MVRVRRVTSARAAGEGLYRSCAMACSTRARVAGRTFGRSLSTRETVWCETPASRATSKMFDGRGVPPSSAPVRGSAIGILGARHQCKERVDGQLIGGERLGDAAVAEDRDAIADA